MQLRIGLSLVLGLTGALAWAQQPAGPAGANAPALFDKGRNALSGSGASRNDLQAVEYFRRSADLGYAPAQVVMGYFSDTGTLAPREPQQAADWYRKAANQGDRLGQWLLGRLYFFGIGVSRDLNQAQNWLKPAAEQGDPFAQYLLGRVKAEDANDYAAAASWFRKSGEQGLPQAQARLGRLLKEGRGVPVDKYQAYVWLLLSFEQGNQSLDSELQQLETDLTSAQIEQAKTEVRKLQATVLREVAARGCTNWPGEFDELPAPPPPKLQPFCR